jgi:hypothetical protein
MRGPECSEPPEFGIVAIAGSAGGIEAMRQILASLPADFPAPILYVHHLNGSYSGVLIDVLQRQTVLTVRWAEQGDKLTLGTVHVCPSGCSCFVHSDGRVALQTVTHLDILHTADHLFTSVAATYAQRAVVIVLSGGCDDGSDGVRAVHSQHGTVIVQDEASATNGSMPRAAISTGCADMVLPLGYIAPALVNLVRDGSSLGTLRTSAGRISAAARAPLSPALQFALNRVLAVALRMHGTDLGNIQLLDPQTGKLVIAAQRGFGLGFLDHFSAIGVEDESACGRAMRGRQSIFIPDVTTDSLFVDHRSVAQSAKFRAVKSTPLINQHGALFGVLSTHFRGFRQMPAAEIHWLDHKIHLQVTSSGLPAMWTPEHKNTPEFQLTNGANCRFHKG